MAELSTVRQNLMDDVTYRPYCGNDKCYHMPRVSWTGEQFECKSCGWVSQFTKDFITRYKQKHNLK